MGAASSHSPLMNWVLGGVVPGGGVIREFQHHGAGGGYARLVVSPAVGVQVGRQLHLQVEDLRL